MTVTRVLLCSCCVPFISPDPEEAGGDPIAPARSARVCSQIFFCFIFFVLRVLRVAVPEGAHVGALRCAEKWHNSRPQDHAAKRVKISRVEVGKCRRNTEQRNTPAKMRIYQNINVSRRSPFVKPQQDSKLTPVAG